MAGAGYGQVNQESHRFTAGNFNCDTAVLKPGWAKQK
jgi:hypothetical protein